MMWPLADSQPPANRGIPMKSTPRSPSSELKLAEYLCFAVYSTNLAFGKVYRPILDELGLTYTQYVTIIALYEQDNQTVHGLGDNLFLESNTLTPILKKLESLGYLERARDPQDERQVRVSLTKNGRRLREKAFSINLGDACALTPDAFTKLQSEIVTLRSNLVKAIEAAD